MNFLNLVDADRAGTGGKAAPLAELMRTDFNVPAGFVVPGSTYREVLAPLSLAEIPLDGAEARSQILCSRLPDFLVTEVIQALGHITEGAPTDYVAVRSSSIAEDNPGGSAAGQHDSFLAVRGAQQVCQAILRCWASSWSDRAISYRARKGDNSDKTAPEMAVLVQRFVDARVSGIMFTGNTSVIEASWGVGERIVGGHVTPDSWRVGSTGIITHRLGSKLSRTDRVEDQLLTRPTSHSERRKLCLTDEEVADLHALGRRISTELGGPRDVEWAIAGDKTWVLQARPVTASLPDSVTPGPVAAEETTLIGEPASSGVATGPVRIVRGPGDFPSVNRGDVLVCGATDPAWTPLFTIASAVVTETGGVLSHAAIVAREVGIPAVLAVPGATERLNPLSTVTVDGTTGRITLGDS